MDEIQGDLLLGHSKKREAQLYFQIVDSGAFRRSLGRLPVTSARVVYHREHEDNAVATGAPPPDPRFTIAFTYDGLRLLDAPAVRQLTNDDEAEPFVEGMAGRAVAVLHDSDPSGWLVGQPGETLHGVIIVTWGAEVDPRHELDRLLPAKSDATHGLKRLGVLFGNVRPDEMEGHEHFGFLDGVSQPGLRGCVDAARTEPLTVSKADPDQGLPGQDLLWPGEFVFGYSAQSRGAATFKVEGTDKTPPLSWMRDGSYLVIRRLTQLVPEMHHSIDAKAEAKRLDAQRVKAQMVGRWPMGAPVLPTDSEDGSPFRDRDDEKLGGDPDRNNAFEFGDDRAGFRCPWAAHIRKAYPRDEVRNETGEPDESVVDRAEAETQTHRMLRRGIQFGPELTPDETATRRTSADRGLLFRCYVTDIARQFEHVQRRFCNSPDFAHVGAGIDPIIGQAPNGGARPFLGAGADGKPSFDFEPWVRMTGGGYFFAPSLSFLRQISEG